MSIKESLEKCLQELPEEHQRELLEYAEFLKWREEKHSWQQFGKSHGKNESAPNEDEAGAAWAMGVAREWSAELSDVREDIYTLNDGEPINGRR